VHSAATIASYRTAMSAALLAVMHAPSMTQQAAASVGCMDALAAAGLIACGTLTTGKSPLTRKTKRRPKAALVSTNQLLVSSLHDDGERIQVRQDRGRTTQGLKAQVQT
jgi:hypothetical protein